MAPTGGHTMLSCRHIITWFYDSRTVVSPELKFMLMSNVSGFHHSNSSYKNKANCIWKVRKLR